MSSIGGIGSSFSISAYSQIQAASGARRNHGPQRLENDLTNFLTTQGISSEEQTEILSEIKSSLSAQRSSSAARPDRSELINTVSSVLQAHGIDGGKFAQSIPEPPQIGGANPPPALPLNGDDKTQDPLEQLFDLLAKAWKKALGQTDSGSGNNSTATPVQSANADPSGNANAAANSQSDTSSNSNSVYQSNVELSLYPGELNILV